MEAARVGRAGGNARAANLGGSISAACCYFTGLAVILSPQQLPLFAAGCCNILHCDTFKQRPDLAAQKHQLSLKSDFAAIVAFFCLTAARVALTAIGVSEHATEASSYFALLCKSAQSSVSSARVSWALDCNLQGGCKATNWPAIYAHLLLALHNNYSGQARVT